MLINAISIKYTLVVIIIRRLKSDYNMSYRQSSIFTLSMLAVFATSKEKMESASVALYKRKLKQKVSLLNCWALVFLCMYIGFMSDKKVSWTSSSHFYATKKKKWRRYIFFILSSLLLVRWLVQTCWENLLDVIGMKNSFSLYFLNNKIKVIK